MRHFSLQSQHLALNSDFVEIKLNFLYMIWLLHYKLSHFAPNNKLEHRTIDIYTVYLLIYLFNVYIIYKINLLVFYFLV